MKGRSNDGCHRECHGDEQRPPAQPREGCSNAEKDASDCQRPPPATRDRLLARGRRSPQRVVLGPRARPPNHIATSENPTRINGCTRTIAQSASKQPDQWHELRRCQERCKYRKTPTAAGRCRERSVRQCMAVVTVIDTARRGVRDEWRWHRGEARLCVATTFGGEGGSVVLIWTHHCPSICRLVGCG